jgi:hypothetical protein
MFVSFLFTAMLTDFFAPNKSKFQLFADLFTTCSVFSVLRSDHDLSESRSVDVLINSVFVKIRQLKIFIYLAGYCAPLSLPSRRRSRCAARVTPHR